MKAMRFEARLTFWIEVEDLNEAERAIDAAQDAAYEVLGAAAIDDPEGGGMCGASFHGVNDEATAALTADGLGPGRSSMKFRGEPC